VSETLDAALRYAAAGWPVFPCKPSSKEPATRHGFKDATTDPAAVTAWWTRTPMANVAIATGAPGPDVLDVDVKPDGSGFAAFNRLRRAGMLAEASALVTTRNGGLHVYFAGTGQPCGRLPRRYLDFKATGGYVLAPPSAVPADGWASNGTGGYALLGRRGGTGRLDWAAVARLLDPPVLPPRRSRPGGGDVTGLTRWLAGQPEGNRNAALFWAACRAVETGLDAGLDEMVAAAVDAGLDEGEARRTTSSASRRLGGRS
jgi:hypothetical protein